MRFLPSCGNCWLRVVHVSSRGSMSLVEHVYGKTCINYLNVNSSLIHSGFRALQWIFCLVNKTMEHCFKKERLFVPSQSGSKHFAQQAFELTTIITNNITITIIIIITIISAQVQAKTFFFLGEVQIHIGWSYSYSTYRSRAWWATSAVIPSKAFAFSSI